MAGRQPEQGVPELDRYARRIEATWPEAAGAEHPVSEFAAVNQGALSPFGDDITFPLPTTALRYEHPDARPNRAGE